MNKLLAIFLARLSPARPSLKHNLIQDCRLQVTPKERREVPGDTGVMFVTFLAALAESVHLNKVRKMFQPPEAPGDESVPFNLVTYFLSFHVGGEDDGVTIITGNSRC